MTLISYDISIYNCCMPHVSRRSLPRKTELELINSLKVVIRRTNRNEDVEKLISSLLTKTEKLMIAKRLAIIILLKEGLQQQDVADTLSVTRETVERLGLISQVRGEGYEIAIEKLKDEKVYEQFKKTLMSLARYAIRAAGGYVKPGVFD